VNEEMARDNVELHRRVTDLEAQDRERLSRIAWLKLEVQRLKDALATPATGGPIDATNAYVVGERGCESLEIG
jgi:hypothetical protein